MGICKSQHDSFAGIVARGNSPEMLVKSWSKCEKNGIEFTRQELETMCQIIRQRLVVERTNPSLSTESAHQLRRVLGRMRHLCYAARDLR